MRNLFFIAVISVLIWVTADMEVTKDENFRATILLTTRNSEDMVLQSTGKLSVNFKLRGSRRILGQFQCHLQDSNSILLYDVSRNFGPGENDIRTEDLLNDSGELSRRSLSVVSAVPGKISFTLDRRVSQKVKVVVDSSGASFSEPPRIEPSEIGVRMAGSDLEELRKQQNVPPGELITFKTRKINLQNFPIGKAHSVHLDILSPSTRFPVALETTTVRVTLTISQRTDEKPFSVTVQVRFPHTWTEDGTWKEYEMIKKDPPEWRPQISVRGAKQDLDRLRSEDIDTEVVLTDDDKTPVASWLERKVTVRFPGKMNLEVVSELPSVHFKLEKRPVVSPAP